MQRQVIGVMMSNIPTVLEERTIESARLKTRVLFSGPRDNTPVVFIHGNLAAATWYEETINRLPNTYHAIAPDLRGYGGSDKASLVDATRGLKDFSDDLAALMETLGVSAAHLVGHSLGGGVLWQFLADYPQMVLSLTQICPSSPYGFGCSKPDGTPCYADGAGSGAAAANPNFARLLAAGETGRAEHFAPYNILNGFAWKPPFVPERMDDILASTLAQHTGDKSYPGDFIVSQNWPGVAPGNFGSVNAMAPNHQQNPLGFCEVSEKPPVLWVRGLDDAVVSDNSTLDLGSLGKMGAVPGWPGEEVFPPQLMVTQTAYALDQYEQTGGEVERCVMLDCGHTPYLERPEEFDAVFHAFLQQHVKIAELRDTFRPHRRVMV